jgi:predicted  nucleic acid-binding Zn-ribbon protein
VTINPGPRLNIVVGPNGTGKSSIVCAIAIGLGAKTSLLGRSDHLGEFVMQGCEDGFVEIELFKVGGGENPVIRRCLSSSSASCKWFLNGLPSNAKDVQKVVDRTGAQIGNLCTFLPQEKVGEFSGFDAVQLLAETEKAVGGPTHYAEHLELCALQHEMGDAARQLEAKKAKVEELEAQNASLERDRKKMEERDLHEAKAKLCQKRLLWINFEEIQDEARKLKEDKEKLESELKASAGHLEPMKELVRKAAAEVGQYTKRAADARAKLEPMVKKQAQLLEKAAKEHETADSYKEDISNLGVRAKDLEKKVAKLLKELDANQAKLSAFDREAIKAACAVRFQKTIKGSLILPSFSSTPLFFSTLFNYSCILRAPPRFVCRNLQHSFSSFCVCVYVLAGAAEGVQGGHRRVRRLRGRQPVPVRGIPRGPAPGEGSPQAVHGGAGRRGPPCQSLAGARRAPRGGRDAPARVAGGARHAAVVHSEGVRPHGAGSGGDRRAVCGRH